MTKEPRENRVPIMMSNDELASIDDWRFANRVATRSDAVRRLCQMALVLDAESERLTDLVLDWQFKGIDPLQERIAAIPEDPEPGYWEDMGVRFVEQLVSTSRHGTRLATALLKVLNARGELVTEPELQKALDRATEAAKSVAFEEGRWERAQLIEDDEASAQSAEEPTPSPGSRAPRTVK